MRRVGRPPLGEEMLHLIAIPVDPRVLDQFRKEARRRRVGYQTLINEVPVECELGCPSASGLKFTAPLLSASRAFIFQRPARNAHRSCHRLAPAVTG